MKFLLSNDEMRLAIVSRSLCYCLLLFDVVCRSLCYFLLLLLYDYMLYVVLQHYTVISVRANKVCLVLNIDSDMWCVTYVW